MLTLTAACLVALAVIWVGYPLAMWVIGFFRPRLVPVVSGWREPSVSMILATRDAPQAIAGRARDFAAQVYASTAGTVVGLDAASESTTADVEAVVPAGTFVVKASGPGGKAGALNAAVAAATGDVLVFSDTAQRFLPGAVAALAGALSDGRLGAVSGALRIGADDRPRSPSELYWRGERWLREREARVHSVVGVTGAIYAVRRELWSPLPEGLILDDVYTPMRMLVAGAGTRVGFVPTAVAVDERRFGSDGEYRRKVRTLTGVLQLCALLPEVLVPRRNPVFLQFLFHKLLRLLTPYLLLGAGLGAMALVLRSAWSGRGAERLAALGLLGLIAVVMLAARRLRKAAGEFAALQAAVVRATMNGLRGQWDVWSR